MSAKLVQLEPPGPYSLQAVEKCSNLSRGRDQSPVHIHLDLEGGTQLQLPTKEAAAKQIYEALKGLFEPEQNSGRMVRIHQVQELPTFYWTDDGARACADFQHTDGTTIVLSIPFDLFQQMRGAIGEMLRDRGHA